MDFSFCLVIAGISVPLGVLFILSGIHTRLYILQQDKEQHEQP